jgi:predicted permease
VSRRWRNRLAIPAVLLLATIVCLVASTPGDVLFGIGWGIFGVLLVFLVAYAFLAIGESEDRERERDERNRRQGR